MMLRRLARVLGALLVLAGIGALLVWAFLEGHQEWALERERERPVTAVSRVSVQEHDHVIALDQATQAQSGIVVTSLEASSHQEERKGYGTVMDVDDLIALRKDMATAQAEVDKAQAHLEASRQEYERAQALHADNRISSDKALQAATAAWHTDAANARAAQAARRALEGTARQRWGPVLATWVFEASPDFDRLSQRQEVLLQITIPPDVALASAPPTASIQAADGTRSAARLVSPAPRTDPRIQGLSFFYLAPARSQGLLPGMNVLAYLPVGPPVQGVRVPAAAVVWWQGTAWVYVQKDSNHFMRRAIATEMPVPEGWFVSTGLAAGDSIVVRGAQLLLSEEFRAQIQVRE